jgi:hypothetical protein
MDRRQRFGTAAAVIGAVAGVVVALVFPRSRSSAPEPPPPAPPAKVFPARDPPPHPVIPSEPRVEVPKAFCEARDIFRVGGELRAVQKQANAALAKASKQGDAPSCHDDPLARDLAGAFNALVGRTGACVARDSQLDSQWSQLESAVVALDRCLECTHPRADRQIGCIRILELVTAAEKATPPN